MFQEALPDLEEIALLEATLVGKEFPRHSRQGTCGRLAELYLRNASLPMYAQKAMQYVRRGLDLLELGSPFYHKLRHFEAMTMRSIMPPEPGTLGINGQAAACDRAAIKACYAANPQDAFVFAQAWGDWAWEKRFFAEAGEAYTAAARCLQRHLRRHIPDEKTRLELFQQSSSISRGAFALAQVNKAQEAVVLLERSNHFLYAAQEDAQALKRLQTLNPSLASKLAILAKPTRGSSQSDLLVEASCLDDESGLEAEQVVHDIRKIAGFQNFARDADWADIALAACQTPLLYLSSSSYGSTGFLITSCSANSADSSHSANSVNIRTLSFPQTTTEFQSELGPFLLAEHERAPASDVRQTLLDVLEWLGDQFMASIKIALQECDPPTERLVLVPIGLMALAPFHAAFTKPRPDTMHVLFHPMSISYAISAHGLVRSRRKMLATTSKRALMVSNPLPLPSTYDSLLLSEAEAEVVREYFVTETLIGQNATVAAILEKLPFPDILHLSCHGLLDKRFGYSSVLLMAKREILSSSQLRTSPSLAAQLVVLSACSSGILALHTEQTLSLPGQFLAIGAANVIATLWHSDELATLLLLKRFYAIWNNGACEILRALGMAQAWLMSAPAQELRAQLSERWLASPAAEALREAQSDERIFAHPWYWAAFTLSGA